MTEARDPHERERMAALPPLEPASRERAKDHIAELRRVLAGEVSEPEDPEEPF